jgi:hypothetical protein
MAIAFRATTQILEEPEAIVDKTAPAKWPKSDCRDRKADEYGASMATIGLQSASAFAVEYKLFVYWCALARSGT